MSHSGQPQELFRVTSLKKTQQLPLQPTHYTQVCRHTSLVQVKQSIRQCLARGPHMTPKWAYVNEHMRMESNRRENEKKTIKEYLKFAYKRAESLSKSKQQSSPQRVPQRVPQKLPKVSKDTGMPNLVEGAKQGSLARNRYIAGLLEKALQEPNQDKREGRMVTKTNRQIFMTEGSPQKILHKRIPIRLTLKSQLQRVKLNEISLLTDNLKGWESQDPVEGPLVSGTTDFS